MKRILIFSTAYIPFIGGAEIAVREITARIQDYEFHVITVDLDGRQLKQETIHNVTIHRVGTGKVGKFLLPVTGLLKAIQLHRQKKYDVIWSIMASQASIAASFFKIIHPSIPLILTIQEGDEETHLARYVFNSAVLYSFFIRPWHVLVFKKATTITAISTYLAVRAATINPRANVRMIPNGVDIDRFSSTYPDHVRDEIIREIGKEKDDTLIITTSRLVEKNAVGDIIAALPYLAPSVKLVVIGIGQLESTLKQQVANLQLESRVRFLGMKAYEDIPKYLSVASVFVRPSLSEGMGNSFIEAMAAGIPVVATPVGGIPDFLKDRETGLLCEPHNPRSVASKVQELLDNPGLRNHIIVHAQNLVREKYTWDGVTEQMKKTFQ